MTESDANLKSYFDRAVRILTEIGELNTDLKELLKAAKGDGYEPGHIRKLATLEAADAVDEYARKRAMLDTYAASIGIQLEMPLGNVARVTETLARDGVTVKVGGAH